MYKKILNLFISLALISLHSTPSIVLSQSKSYSELHDIIETCITNIAPYLTEAGKSNSSDILQVINKTGEVSERNIINDDEFDEEVTKSLSSSQIELYNQIKSTHFDNLDTSAIKRLFYGFINDSQITVEKTELLKHLELD